MDTPRSQGIRADDESVVHTHPFPYLNEFYDLAEVWFSFFPQRYHIMLSNFPHSCHPVHALRLNVSGRKTPLKYVFPVDDAIDYHKILGTLVFVFAWIHSLCHVNDIWRWGDPARIEEWKKAFPDEETQPTRMEIVMSLVGVTGILQLLIYTIVFLTASNWPRRSEWMKNTRVGKV